jgi:hypothetical protein
MYENTFFQVSCTYICLHQLLQYSVEPTVSPTKSPWSETAFITFLYGDSTASEGSGSDSGSSSNGEETNNGMLASEVNNALTNYDELQYHFYCGYSW